MPYAAGGTKGRIVLQPKLTRYFISAFKAYSLYIVHKLIGIGLNALHSLSAVLLINPDGHAGRYAQLLKKHYALAHARNIFVILGYLGGAGLAQARYLAEALRGILQNIQRRFSEGIHNSSCCAGANSLNEPAGQIRFNIL